MAEKYIQTAVRVGWLLQELESELTAVNDGFRRRSFVRPKWRKEAFAHTG